MTSAPHVPLAPPAPVDARPTAGQHLHIEVPNSQLMAIVIIAGAATARVGDTEQSLVGPSLLGPLPTAPLTLIADIDSHIVVLPLASTDAPLPPRVVDLSIEAASSAARALLRWGEGHRQLITYLSAAQLTDTLRWMKRGIVRYLVIAGQLWIEEGGAGGMWHGPGAWIDVAAEVAHPLRGSQDVAVVATAPTSSLSDMRHHIPPEPWRGMCAMADLNHHALLRVDSAGAILATNPRAEAWFLTADNAQAPPLIQTLFTQDSRSWLIKHLAGGAPGHPARGQLRRVGGSGPPLWSAVSIPYAGLGQRASFLLWLSPQPEDPAEEAAKRHRRAIIQAIEPLGFALRRLVERRAWVIAWGEEGSGRHLFAQALHEASPWSTGPLRHLDVTEERIPQIINTLTTGRPGHLDSTLEALAGGALLIDGLDGRSAQERGDLLAALTRLQHHPQASQMRLIVVMGQRPHRGLEPSRTHDGLVERGPFTLVHTPLLGETPGAVPLLSKLCLEEAAHRLSQAPARLSPEALKAIALAGWPQNLGDLKALCDHLASSAPGITVGAKTVQQAMTLLAPGSETTREDDIPTLFEAEGIAVRRALEHTGGNKAQAARLLGITRTRLYRKIAEHQLDAFLV